MWCIIWNTSDLFHRAKNLLILVFWTFWYMYFVKELRFLIQLKFMWLIYQYPPAHGQLFIWCIACINKPESNNRKGLWFGFYGFWVCSGSGIEGFSIASFLPQPIFSIFLCFWYFSFSKYFSVFHDFDNVWYFCVCQFCVFSMFFSIFDYFLIFALW